MAVQPAFALPEPLREYAAGKRYGDHIDWLGVVRAPNLGAAEQLALRELGDPRVGTCPMEALSDTDKALARAGRLIQVRG